MSFSTWKSKHYKKIKTFIYERINKFKNTKRYVVTEYRLKEKSGILIKYSIDVLITGLIIYYALTHFNPLSCGLIVVLIVYYVKAFIIFMRQQITDVIKYIQRR